MKIVVLSFLYGEASRGAETWAQELKAHMSSLCDIEIVSSKASFLPWMWGSADIYIPTNGRLQVLICRIFTWLIHKPMVVFGHSGPGADDKWNLLCLPNVFVCFTHVQSAWAKKFKKGSTDVVVIPHAVDLHKFTPASKKPIKKTVLCVASNQPSKRIGLVERAVSTLQDVDFLAVGVGNPLHVDFTKMPGVYKLASIFCFVPVAWEAFGLVYLEAMASNLPIVAPDDPIRREIIGDAGIFVQHPEDIHDLARAINQALSREWRDLPLKQAEKFSWNLATTRYNKLFTGL